MRPYIAFIVVGVLLLMGWAVRSQEPAEPVTITAKVAGVSKLWTKNGDGSLTLTVNVVGEFNDEPATKVKLKTVKHVQDLVGKRVKVTFASSDDSSALIVEELPSDK